MCLCRFQFASFCCGWLQIIFISGLFFDSDCFLDCLSPVFHHGLPKYLSDDIEGVQKRALKIISPSMSYTDKLTRFNLQSLKARREDYCRRLFSTVLSDQTHKLRALLPPVNNSHYDLRTKRRFQRFVSNTNRFNPLTAERALRALIDFTPSNARRFYSSMGNPLDGKGLITLFYPPCVTTFSLFNHRIHFDSSIYL